MKIEKLKPGMTVYDVGRHRMGNTTMFTAAVWTVHIIEVNLGTQTVTASWNGNRAEKFSQKIWSKWRLNRPKMISNAMGISRLAKRGE